MKIRNIQLTAVAALALALAGTTSAFAQQPAAPRAAPNPLPSQPPIAGVCTYSRDATIVGSRVGQYIQQRLKTIGDQTGAEVQSTAQTLQTDVTAFDGRRATLTQEQLEQQALQLRQRNEQFQRLQQVREREMQMTVQKTMQRFDTETSPLVELAVRERNCAIVFDGDAVYWVSPTMDLTPSVVQKLDAKLTEFAFERERMEQQQAAAPAATPPRPATTPARPPATRR